MDDSELLLERDNVSHQLAKATCREDQAVLAEQLRIIDEEEQTR